MNTKEATEILTNNEDIKFLFDFFTDFKKSSVFLTGGAIVDILNNKYPKDFDIYTPNDIPVSIVNYIYSKGGTFICDSKYSSTFRVKGNRVIQVLKIQGTDRFDFTINQSRIRIDTTITAKTLLDFDELSFNTKIAIPTTASYVEGIHKSRVKLVIRKGFEIPKTTMRDLIVKGSFLERLKSVFEKENLQS
jgi:hypothetical protein